ncbi:MAG: hypothetical protein WAM83_01325, partial [Bradyrhizobium sp.]
GISDMLARLKPLPLRLRIAHLAALLRCEADGSPRVGELTRLLSFQSAALTASIPGGRAG